MGATNPHLHHLPFPLPFPCKQKLILTAIYFLIIPLSLLNLYFFFLSPHPNHLPPPLHNTTFLSQEPVAQPITSKAQATAGRRCDFADGRWVPDPRPPQYTDTSCKTIKSGQNCMAHGRPDTGYLHWRWKPAGCQLIPFSAAAFLDLLVNKHLAFVGDSLARNQLESLLCLLSAATGPPELVYSRGTENKSRRWIFRSHNTTISVYWSPFLVKGIEKSGGRTHNQLYLDSADEQWAAELEGIDIVVLSAGHWFLIPGIFYDGAGEVVGCHHCKDLVNMTETGFFDAFRRAVRTAVRTAAGRTGEGKEKEKLAVVTTFTPAHFEGEWDKAGACERKEPFGEGEKEMEYMDREMRKIELEEAAAAIVESGGGGGGGGRGRVKLEVMDVTIMAMMRPDGHPGPYMNANPFEGGVGERVQNDCLHWCLPGPIDTWNEILLEMVRRWREEIGERGEA